MSYRVYVGAEGWLHESWRGSFYPDDLPQEWELTYYSTQLRCVYLAYASWSATDSAAVDAWLTETRHDFHFVLGGPRTLNEADRNLIERMGDRAVIESVSDTVARIEWFPVEPDLKVLGRRVAQTVERGEVLYLINREAHWPSIDRVKTLVGIMGY